MLMLDRARRSLERGTGQTRSTTWAPFRQSIAPSLQSARFISEHLASSATASIKIQYHRDTPSYLRDLHNISTPPSLNHHSTISCHSLDTHLTLTSRSLHAHSTLTSHSLHTHSISMDTSADLKQKALAYNGGIKDTWHITGEVWKSSRSLHMVYIGGIGDQASSPFGKSLEESRIIAASQLDSHNHHQSNHCHYRYNSCHYVCDCDTSCCAGRRSAASSPLLLPLLRSPTTPSSQHTVSWHHDCGVAELILNDVSRRALCSACQGTLALLYPRSIGMQGGKTKTAISCFATQCSTPSGSQRVEIRKRDTSP